MLHARKIDWLIGVAGFGFGFLSVVYGLVWTVIPDRGIARDPLCFLLLAAPYLLTCIGLQLEPTARVSPVLRLMACTVMLLGVVELAIIMWELVPLVGGHHPVPAMFASAFLVALLRVFVQIPLALGCILAGYISHRVEENSLS